MRRLLICLFALTTSCAIAQTVTTSISLAWVAPTANTDGSLIANPITYTLFQGPKAGPFTQVATGLTGTATVVTSTTAGTCFALAANEIQGASGASAVASGLSPTICALQPNAPTGLSVAITITVK